MNEREPFHMPSPSLFGRADAYQLYTGFAAEFENAGLAPRFPEDPEGTARGRLQRAIRKRNPLNAEIAEMAILTALLFAGFLVRLDGIAGPPLDASRYPSHAVIQRQYHSAILAREYYFRLGGATSSNERLMAQEIKRNEPIVELPLLEAVVAGVWRLVGGEHLWIGRLLSAAFWILGGLFLFRVAMRLTSRPGAFAALATYLFIPFAIVGGRSFQPDPLMVMLLLATLLALLRFVERPSGRRLTEAAALGGASAFVKPGFSLFFLYPVAVGLWLSVRRNRGREFLLFGIVTALPAALYLLYGTYISHFLVGQASDKLVPSLWVKPSFWTGWLSMIAEVLDPRPGLDARPLSLLGGAATPRLGLLLFGAVAAGVIVARSRQLRVVLSGLLIGYVAFGLTFTRHISGHNYYSLALVPIAALSVASAVSVLAATILKLPRPVIALATAGIVGAAILWMLNLHAGLSDPAYGRRAALYKHIGTVVRHTPSAIFLTEDFGLPLEYEGHLTGRLWTHVAREAAGTPPARAIAELQPPPSFFIITDSAEFAERPLLRTFLERRFRRSEGRGYLVFDLRRR